MNRSRWPSMRSVFMGIVAVAVCLGLMQVRWLDPTRSPGGVLLTVGWCLGLLVWSLAVVRKHSSQFGFGFVLLATAAVGLYFALRRLYPPYVPALFTFGAFSLCMLLDGLNRPVPSDYAPSNAKRFVTGSAGALGLAHVLRVTVATIMA